MSDSQGGQLLIALPINAYFEELFSAIDRKYLEGIEIFIVVSKNRKVEIYKAANPQFEKQSHKIFILLE